MIYAVIPTYNEANSIEELVHQLMGLGINLRILFVDDNSPDRTGDVADGLAVKIPGVEVLHNPRKGGLGRAYLRGFRHVFRKGAQRVIKMDADLSHRPEDIPQFLVAAESCDLVIGSRFTRGGEFVAPWYRQLLSRIANLFVSLLFGLGVSDATTGFHCLSREALRVILEEGVISRGFAFQTELIYLAKKAGLRVGEVPIRFVPRQTGESKMNWGEVSGGVKDLLRLRLSRGAKPKG